MDGRASPIVAALNVSVPSVICPIYPFYAARLPDVPGENTACTVTASKVFSEVDAFFVPDGDLMVASELTRGPWDASSQHAGPPAALLGRAIERCDGIGEGPADRHVGRVTYEILAPVPIAPLRVEAEVTRGGKRVDMVEATLSAEGGAPVVRARGWRLLRRDVELPEGLGSSEAGSAAHEAGRPSGEPGSPTPPEEIGRADVFFPTGEEVGYHTAMDVRFDRGSFVEIGPAVAWMRAMHPLVAGEELSPLQRVLIAADSGNGISSTLDFHRFVFINVDLTVHLSRMPAGEWVCLDAVTVPEPHGAGISDTMLRDELGPLGRASQTLLISERS